MPGLLRFTLTCILLVASTHSLAAQSPQAQPSGAPDPVQIVPAFPCADQDVRLTFSYCTCNQRILDTQRPVPLRARILVEVDQDVYCVQCARDTIEIPLGRFAAGHYQFRTEVTYISADPESVFTHSDIYVTEFDVRPACANSGPIPFLNAVNIGEDAACTVCPPHVCAGDSVPVYLHGEFPDTRYSLAEVTVAHDPLDPIPSSYVQLVYSRGCTGIALPKPWSSTFLIPPMLHGSNGLIVRAYLRDDCNPGNLQWLGEARYPMAIDACPVRDGCYIATFHQSSNPCDVFVHPANTGVASLGISSDREIGGAQGRLVFDKSGLRVDSISSPYAGSILKWDRTADGANFVLVVPPDSIPPGPPDVLRQLLNVVIAVDGPPRIGEVVRLTPVDLLVSDADGQALPFCPSFAVPDPSARICSTISCDVNYDSRADVRDLVLLVNCLVRPPGSCQGMDCDFDYDFDLDDVLCCARAILDLGVPPDSVNAVPAPEVTLAFGTPVPVEGGVDLPVMVGGIGRIGAARLEFSYPDETFGSASIELNDHSGHWLALDQASGGRAVFGGIRLSPEDAYGALPLTLHLRTRAGQQVAGSVSFVAGQFSDGNGATLITSARPVTMPIGGGNIALRAARPNPFGAATHFGVGLAQAADLDVGIYDLAGRRVATLFKGRAAAGTHEITWRRTRDDGSLVPSGMYFYRIVSGGKQQGGKVLVLARD